MTNQTPDLPASLDRGPFGTATQAPAAHRNDDQSRPELEPLDDRLRALAERMRASGHVEEADQIEAALAYMREVWRGADQHGSLADDLTVLIDNGATVLGLIGRYLGGVRW